MEALKLRIRLMNVSAIVKDAFNAELGNPEKEPFVGSFLVSPNAKCLIAAMAPLIRASEDAGFLGNGDIIPESLKTLIRLYPELCAVMLPGWISFLDNGKRNFKFIVRIPEALDADESFKKELLKEYGIPERFASFKTIPMDFCNSIFQDRNAIG